MEFRLMVIIKGHDSINARDLRDTYNLDPVGTLTYYMLFRTMRQLWRAKLVNFDDVTAKRARSDGYIFNPARSLRRDTRFSVTNKGIIAIFDSREFYRELAQFRND